MPKKRHAITEYRSYYLPTDFPVLLLSGDYWKISDTPSGRLHFHNCLEIGICHSESGTMEFFGEKQSFKAGDVVIVPKNVPHTTYSTAGTESHWSYIYLDPQLLFKGMLPSAMLTHDLSDYNHSSFKYIFPEEENQTLNPLVLAIIDELNSKKPGFQYATLGLLLTMYIEITRNESAMKPVESKKQNELIIAPALDFIDQNYSEKFTIQELANLCDFCPTHFRRVFYEIMGTSPLDYVNTTRINKACDKLRSTDDSILQISEDVGFHSISSFNRCFIKLMHVSPRDYRKQMKEADGEKKLILEYSGWMKPEA